MYSRLQMLRKPYFEPIQTLSTVDSGKKMKQRSAMADKFEIDDIDKLIIGELRKNGRATNQQIADDLKLTAATVSTRIKRLEKADKLRIVAVSDFRAHGYNVLLEIAIEVDGRPASQVANELAKLPEVFAVHLVTGRYDIDLLVVLREFSDLQDFLLKKLSNIKGIHSMVPAIAVDVIKYKFDIAPITSRDGL